MPKWLWIWFFKKQFKSKLEWKLPDFSLSARVIKVREKSCLLLNMIILLRLYSHQSMDLFIGCSTFIKTDVFYLTFCDFWLQFRLLAEIVTPTILLLVLVMVRTRPDLQEYNHECKSHINSHASQFCSWYMYHLQAFWRDTSI